MTHERIASEVLDAVEEALDAYSDVRDSDHGPMPNVAMRALGELREGRTLRYATWAVDASCCATCEHYDGDGYCALPQGQQIIRGFIAGPSAVWCGKYQAQEQA